MGELVWMLSSRLNLGVNESREDAFFERRRQSCFTCSVQYCDSNRHETQESSINKEQTGDTRIGTYL